MEAHTSGVGGSDTSDTLRSVQRNHSINTNGNLNKGSMWSLAESQDEGRWRRIAAPHARPHLGHLCPSTMRMRPEPNSRDAEDRDRRM